MHDELKKIGLGENEASVYLALLGLGSATAQEIAQKSGVNRATTYVQLESLMRRGLATSYEKQSTKNPPAGGGAMKTFFRAEDPEYLKRVIEKEKASVDARAETLSRLIPQLGDLFVSAGERPRVRFFEGVEGLKSIQDEFLKTKDKEIESFLNLDDVLEAFPKHPEEYTPRRVKMGIRSKLIYTCSRGPFLKESDATMLRESRFIPKEKFPIAGDLAMYGNTVAISIPTKRPFGIVIESEEIARSMRALFYLAWEEAKRYEK